MLSRAAWTEKAERSARRRALRLTLKACERGFGPNAAPPPRRCGTLSAPARARPVPFCFQALAVVIETSPRPSVDAVPRRRAARSARAASWTRLSWNSSPNTVAGRSVFACLPSVVALSDGLAIGADLHGAALRAGDGAPDQQKIVLRVDLEHGQ